MLRFAMHLVVLSFPYFFVFVPFARLSWPFRQLLRASESTISYPIVLYHIISCRMSSIVSIMFHINCLCGRFQEFSFG